MPQEIRHIIFKTKDAVMAIAGYLRSQSQSVPQGTIKNIAIGTSPSVHVSIRVASVSADDDMTLTLGGEDLLSAMIKFCINSKIPLPMAATKKLQVFSDQLTMVITKNLQGDESSYPPYLRAALSMERGAA